MPVISNLGVLEALLVVLPEALYTSGAFVLVSHVVTPCALYTCGHVVPIPVSHGLQGKELQGSMSMRIVKPKSIAALPSLGS